MLQKIQLCIYDVAFASALLPDRLIIVCARRLASPCRKSLLQMFSL